MKYFLILSTLLLIYACSNEPITESNQSIEMMPDSVFESFTSLDSSKTLLIDFHYLTFKAQNKQVTDSLNKFVIQQLGYDSLPKNVVPTNYFKEYAKAFKQEFMGLIADSIMEYIGYEKTLQIEVAYQSENRIGLSANGYLYTAGAHGIGSTLFANINTQNGRKISTSDCFKNTESIRINAEKIFRSNLGITANASLNEAGFWFDNDKFTLTENFLLKDSSVTFFYNVYEIAPYSNGPTSIEVPIQKNQLRF